MQGCLLCLTGRWQRFHQLGDNVWCPGGSFVEGRRFAHWFARHLGHVKAAQGFEQGVDRRAQVLQPSRFLIERGAEDVARLILHRSAVNDRLNAEADFRASSRLRIVMLATVRPQLALIGL